MINCIFFKKWHKQASSSDSDGIELKRKGDVNVNARIILVPDFNPNKYKVGSGLSELIMLKLATKPHVIMEVWNYVKVNQVYLNIGYKSNTYSSNIDYKMKRIKE